MRILGKEWDPLEITLAASGLALTALTASLPHRARIISAVVLGLNLIVLLAVGIARRFRSAYFVPGVKDVVHHLADLAAKSTSSVWTVRAHQGEAEGENEYFEKLAARILGNELDDLRRLIVLNSTQSTRVHLHWLVSKFADQEAVKVRVVEKPSLPFDFAIFDGRVGAIGFPQVEREGFLGALIVKHTRAVRGLEIAFSILWEQATPLFSGNARITQSERDKLHACVDTILNVPRLESPAVQ